MQIRASLTRRGKRRPIESSRSGLQVKIHDLANAGAPALERKRILLNTLRRWLAHGWPSRSIAATAQEFDGRGR
jgi:hypothetical protein